MIIYPSQYPTEHTCCDRTPFTYYICWSKLNIHYYGSKYAKGCHPNCLWNPYKTSSEHVAAFIKEHGDPDIIQVRKIFDDVDKCREYEHKVLKRLDVIHRDEWLNETNNRGFSIESCTLSEENRQKNRNRMILKGKQGELWTQKEENKEELKERMSKSGYKRAEDNTLWLQSDEGKSIMRQIQLDLVKQGKHNFQSEETKRKNGDRLKAILADPHHREMLNELVRDLVKQGKHNFQSEEAAIQSSIRQLDLVKQGKHNFQSEKARKEAAERNKRNIGSKWYTNGERNIRIHPGDIIPPGFRLGKTDRKSPNIDFIP